MEEYQIKIEKIISWASFRNANPKIKKKFDTDFVENINSFIEDDGFISDKQMECVDKIIEKFKITI